MQFKHPEILYALLLLIIPIIVHLFQLRRFKKVPFTNVDFLKKINLKTRKNSQLKKWLILALRMLAFASIILAFSQPFFSKNKNNESQNLIVYLDNSLSMQAKGKNGNLLNDASQELIKNLEENSTISFITNDEVYKNIDVKTLKNELTKIDFSAKKENLSTILLKSEQLKSNTTNTSNKIILISDFQNINKIIKQDVTNVNSSISLVKRTPNSNFNISIDSVFIADKNNKEITLKVQLKSSNIALENCSVSLFNESVLVGKTATPILENETKIVTFKIPKQEKFNGILKIEDENLTFDNSLFFNLNSPKKINILSIGKTSNYLSKIYTKNEFNFTQKNSRNLDYNIIKNQQLILLNELENIPNELIQSLLEYNRNGGNLVVIPSSKINSNSYNQLFSKLNIGKIENSSNQELKINNINYSHPILSDVFEKKVSNFDYPLVKKHYNISYKNQTPIVSFQNNKPFISELKRNNSSIYVLNSSLDKQNTNFTNYPLIVPIFYNFGKYSSNISQLYYTLNSENEIEIDSNLKKDEVVKLKNETEEFIPLQEIKNGKITIKPSNQIKTAGFYDIISNNKTLKTIAFNYNRQENDLNFADIESIFKNNKNTTINNSISETFQKMYSDREIKSYFKWFLGLAILFLLLEIGILKFFKP